MSSGSCTHLARALVRARSAPSSAISKWPLPAPHWDCPVPWGLCFHLSLLVLVWPPDSASWVRPVLPQRSPAGLINCTACGWVGGRRGGWRDGWVEGWMTGGWVAKRRATGYQGADSHRPTCLATPKPRDQARGLRQWVGRPSPASLCQFLLQPRHVTLPPRAAPVFTPTRALARARVSPNTHLGHTCQQVTCKHGVSGLSRSSLPRPLITGVCEWRRGGKRARRQHRPCRSRSGCREAPGCVNTGTERGRPHPAHRRRPSGGRGGGSHSIDGPSGARDPSGGLWFPWVHCG